MEGIREKVRQKPAFRVFYARNVRNQPQGRTVSHAPHHRVEIDCPELIHIWLSANPVVSQEHHGLFAQLVRDVHHLSGQCSHLPALESHKIQILPGRRPVLIIIVSLINDKFRAERISGLLFKPLQNIGRDRG